MTTQAASLPPTVGRSRQRSRHRSLRPACPWCASSSSRIVLSRGCLDAPVFRRRRRCLECHRTWPTTEALDLERFAREAERAGVSLSDLGLAGVGDVSHEREAGSE